MECALRHRGAMSAGGVCPEAQRSSAAGGMCTEAQRGSAAGGRCTEAQRGSAAGGRCTGAQRGSAAGGRCTEAQRGSAAGGRCTEAQRGSAAGGQCLVSPSSLHLEQKEALINLSGLQVPGETCQDLEGVGGERGHLCSWSVATCISKKSKKFSF